MLEIDSAVLESLENHVASHERAKKLFCRHEKKSSKKPDILHWRELIPEQDKKFEVLQIVGNGGFATVYKCKRLRTNNPQDTDRKVAVKVQEKMCPQEATILKWLRPIGDEEDSHVTLLLEQFLHKGRMCLVFELMPTNLCDILHEMPSGSLSLSQISAIAKQLLMALKWLKKKGVIHADLKPDNVLVDPKTSGWRVKLSDFGLAFLKEDSDKFRGFMIQPWPYRAPEVYVGASVSESVDMWSLGCLCITIFLGIDNWFFYKRTDDLLKMHMVVGLLGKPPNKVLKEGKHTHYFFNKSIFGIFSLKGGPRVLKLVKILKARDGLRNLNDIPDRDFVNFLRKALKMNPMRRLDPSQGLKMTFIKNPP